MTHPVPKSVVDKAIAVAKAALPGVSVGDDLPKARPGKFVVVKRGPNINSNIAQEAPRIIFDLYGSSSVDCEDMYSVLIAGLRNTETAAGTDYMYWLRRDEGGPYDLPNPDVTDRKRWQFHGNFRISNR